MNKEEFYIELKKLEIELTDKQKEQLEDFYNLLTKWNKKINLTRITNKEEVYLKHFYDSLTLSKVVDLKEDLTLCDVGTGAGFPGIVLKIVYPNLKITLLDSLQKRVIYLNDIIEKLGLENIYAYHVRAEDYHEKFDIVTARAVANMTKLYGYTKHLIKKEGILIAMKANVIEELEESYKNNTIKKEQVKQVESFILPKEESNRTLVVIKK